MSAQPTSEPTPPTRPHRARRGAGDLLRDEILDATQALLDETGDEAKISIRKVAERVGRTSPSIYLHFPDKASLMWAVCERHYADHEASMAAAAEGIADPLERLASMARAYVRFAVDNPEQFRILFLTDRTKLGGATTVEDLGQTQGFTLVAGALTDAEAAGAIVVPDGDVLAVLVDLWAAVQGIATLLVTRPQGGLPDPDAWVDRFLALALDGLRPR